MHWSCCQHNFCGCCSWFDQCTWCSGMRHMVDHANHHAFQICIIMYSCRCLAGACVTWKRWGNSSSRSRCENHRKRRDWCPSQQLSICSVPALFVLKVTLICDTVMEMQVHSNSHMCYETIRIFWSRTSRWWHHFVILAVFSHCMLWCHDLEQLVDKLLSQPASRETIGQVISCKLSSHAPEHDQIWLWSIFAQLSGLSLALL